MEMSEAARIDGARSRLLRLQAGQQGGSGDRGWVPAWSSRVLEAEVDGILSAPGGGVGDLFQALWTLLEQTNAALDRTLANFIRDIAVLTFTGYRSQYDVADFRWMADRVEAGGTPAQAYLAALALPEELLQRSRQAIVKAMRGNEFLEEVTKLVTEE
jgi:hypothetical protein